MGGDSGTPRRSRRGARERIADLRRRLTEAEAAKDQALHDLNERIKEMAVLRRAASALQRAGRTAPELLQEIVDFVPSGWQYPEITAARIEFDGQEFASPNFAPTPWTQRAEIATTRGKGLVLEVCYLEERPAAAEGPFLAEERILLDSLAEMLHSYLNHQQAENALRREHSNLQAILDAMVDGVYIANQRYEIEYVNPALERSFGPVRGRKCYTYFHDRVEPCPWCKNAEVLAGATVEWEWYSTKTGRSYDLFDTPILGADGTLWKLEILHDITAHREAEEALRQSEKLAALGRLAASLAHEINNPLQSVIGCLGLAQERLAGGRDTGQLLEVARAEIQRLIRLVAQMRSLPRPEAHEKEAVSVNGLIEQVLQLCQKPCAESHVEIDWAPAANLPLLHLVPDQMRQVFLNLILNAIEAMPHGGRLKVRTAWVRSPAGARIEFGDSGVGIAPEALPHIFEPFYSTKPSGSGLGLFVSYGIVKDYGGSIEVQSHGGRGTTFRVWLPKALATPEADSTGGAEQ